MKHASSVTQYGKVTLILCLLCVLTVSAGCEKRVRYLRDGQKCLPVKQGEIVPADGWFLTGGGLADYYDWLEAETKRKEARRKNRPD